MIELRLLRRVPDDELAEKIGKHVTDADYNLVLTREVKLRKPDGSLLCIYRPGVLGQVMSDQWARLSAIRDVSYNRGLASGSRRATTSGPTSRTKSRPIHSATLGAMDPMRAGGGRDYCRLTAWTNRNAPEMEALRPVFLETARWFAEDVPARFAVQAEYAARTHPDWLIEGTPFSTITVNNTYATGVHTDKGDLEAGFSCLAVARRGEYAGGLLVFPAFRVAVDMRDGDLLLMDAHEYHGNTRLACAACGVDLSKPGHDCPLLGEGHTPPERVSIVHYFRTMLTECDSLAAETEKRETIHEHLNQQRLGIAEPTTGGA